MCRKAYEVALRGRFPPFSCPVQNNHAFSACPPAARHCVVVTWCGGVVCRRVFCPCVLRNFFLDFHVRKPPGDDAGGDVVSVELLRYAMIRILVCGRLVNGAPRRRCGSHASFWTRNHSRDSSRVRFEPSLYGEATWLILPVVICLSQRLSHACLSTCRIKAKPRMAH